MIQDLAKIQLRIEDGEPLKPSLLCFNAYGLENVKGLRGQKDGQVHFGGKRYHEENGKMVPYCDYVFEAGPDEIYPIFGDRHFSINYEYCKINHTWC